MSRRQPRNWSVILTVIALALAIAAAYALLAWWLIKQPLAPAPVPTPTPEVTR